MVVLGWSFHHTPIELREQVAIPSSHIPLWMQSLSAALHIEELFILSTCNRTEWYFNSEFPEAQKEKLLIEIIKKTNLPQLKDLCYTYQGLEALSHLFRVTCSLDSMVLGETQILGQLKTAYQQFLEVSPQSKIFKNLIPKAFSVAKRVRTETTIAQSAVSISFAAVELAKRIFSSLKEQTLLVIGAGEMAELALKYFVKNGTSQVLITNRTFAHAMALAEKYRGSAIHWDQLTAYLPQVDIVISSTGAQHPILTQSMVQKFLKQKKDHPMFFIDIAVPRDIDYHINELPNMYVYDIDDLQEVVKSNRKGRELAAIEAERIIQEEVEKVDYWLQTRSITPTLKALREQFHQISQNEIDLALKRLGLTTEEQRQQLEKIFQGLTKKLLHLPSVKLKEVRSQEDTLIYAETLKQLFDLTTEKKTLICILSKHPIKNNRGAPIKILFLS